MKSLITLITIFSISACSTVHQIDLSHDEEKAFSYLYYIQKKLGRFNSGSYAEELVSASKKQDINCIHTALHSFYDNEEITMLYNLAHTKGDLFEVFRAKHAQATSNLGTFERLRASREFRNARDISNKAVEECVLVKSKVTSATNIQRELQEQKYFNKEHGQPIIIWNGTPYYSHQRIKTIASASGIIEKQESGLETDILMGKGKTGTIIKVMPRLKTRLINTDIEQPQSVMIKWDRQSWKNFSQKNEIFPEFTSSIHVSYLE